MADRRYLRLLEHLLYLHKVKSQGYATQEDPWANFRGSLERGIKASDGAWIRKQDKDARLKNLKAERVIESHGEREGVLQQWADRIAYEGIEFCLWAEENGVTDEQWDAAFPVPDEEKTTIDRVSSQIAYQPSEEAPQRLEDAFFSTSADVPSEAEVRADTERRAGVNYSKSYPEDERSGLLEVSLIAAHRSHDAAKPLKWCKYCTPEPVSGPREEAQVTS